MRSVALSLLRGVVYGTITLAPLGCTPGRSSQTARPPAPTGGETLQDTDRDGIPDPEDLCREEPEDFDECYDEDGCSDPDNDADGIADVDDRCPYTSGVVAQHGCPALPKPGVVIVQETNDSCMLLEHVPFAKNQSALAAEALRVVEQVARCLERNPQVLQLGVRGQRAASESATLGDERAHAVHVALVAHGVNPLRLRLLSSDQDADAFRPRLAVDFVILREMKCRVDAK